MYHSVNFLELEKALEELFGGNEYFLTQTISSYGHNIHFEFLLNKDGLPIPPSQWQEYKACGDRYHKVAIYTADFHKYCYDTKGKVTNLRGRYSQIVQQLEQQEYSVIVVPIFEWVSMSRSKWSEKVNYLRQKLKPLFRI